MERATVRRRWPLIMPSALVAFIVTSLVFVALDALWLGTMSERLYRPQLGALMRESPNWGAAAAFYLIYVAALTVLVVLPAIDRGAPLSALWRGALFGFAAYATYNLTNLATVRGWPAGIIYIDNTWGALLTAAAAFVGAWAALRFAS